MQQLNNIKKMADADHIKTRIWFGLFSPDPSLLLVLQDWIPD